MTAGHTSAAFLLLYGFARLTGAQFTTLDCYSSAPAITVSASCN